MAEYANRRIVDEVVENNKHKNPELYDRIGNLPIYSGSVNLRNAKVSLNKLSNIGEISLVDEIRQSAKSLNINGDTGSIDVEVNGVVKSKELPTPIIAFFKSCLIMQYNTCYDYGIAVALFVKEAMVQLISDGNINLPIQIKYDSKISTVVCNELNALYKEILDSCNQGYHEVVSETSKKKKKAGFESMISAAESANG